MLVIGQAQAQPRTILELADLAFQGGVTALQLREKDLNGSEFYLLALEVANFCRQKNKFFIINDRLDIALAVGADGLHLGADDLPLNVARRYWPRVLGATAKTPAMARQALSQGADYLGLGALFPSPTKPESPVMEPQTREAIKALARQNGHPPLVGIGGLTPENAQLAWSFGLDSLAVVSSLATAADPKSLAQKFLLAQKAAQI
jgi:thiamine-phosphate pyrophosphorylase